MFLYCEYLSSLVNDGFAFLPNVIKRSDLQTVQGELIDTIVVSEIHCHQGNSMIANWYPFANVISGHIRFKSFRMSQLSAPCKEILQRIGTNVLLPIAKHAFPNADLQLGGSVEIMFKEPGTPTQVFIA